MPIHPTAIVDSGAEIDSAADIGPYAVVEGDVQIGPRARIHHHVFVAQGARIAAGVQVHPFAVISHAPQDLAYSGAPSYASVGEDTIVREHASIHRGTAPGSTTVVGARCFLMGGSHVAHNCVVGDDVKMANFAALGGHVQVGRGTFVGGLAGIPQFVRVGAFVMVGALEKATADVPSFMTLGRGRVAGPNVVGMRRAGYTSEERLEVREAHKLLYRSGLHFREAVARLAEQVKTRAGRELLEFLNAPSRRGFASARRRGAGAAEGADQ